MSRPGGLGDPPPGWNPHATEESRQSTEELTTNLAFVRAKDRHMVALRTEAANLGPYTSYLSDQLGQLDAQIAELTAQMGRLQAELDSRADNSGLRKLLGSRACGMNGVACVKCLF